MTKPTILHVGNIANNAYNNALCLQEVVDSTVLCFDYYHATGTPEWEHALDLPKVDDLSFPSFEQLQSGSFERPEWFVQGPVLACLLQLLLPRPVARLATKAVFRPLLISRGTRAGFAWRESFRFVPRTLFQRVEGISAIRILFAEAFLRAAHRALIVWSAIPRVKKRWLSRCEWLISDAQKSGNPSPLCAQDLEKFRTFNPLWRRITSRYDGCIFYANTGTIAWVAGAEYMALEHGTLRDLPFTDSVEGRLTNQCFRSASHTFVTNLDCVEQARVICPSFSLLPHPLRLDLLRAGQLPALADGLPATKEHLGTALDADLIVFNPSRQDWSDPATQAMKANNRLIGAVAEARSKGIRVGFVGVEWGPDVDRSKWLLRDLGLEKNAVWFPPMPNQQMIALANQCDVVGDQFFVDAVGGVFLKLAASDNLVMTRLSVEQAIRCFGSQPPMFAVESQAEILACLQKVATMGPVRRATLSNDLKKWMEKNQSHRLVQSIQTEVFQTFFEKEPSDDRYRFGRKGEEAK